jgi:hypothetical protein
MNDAKQPFVFVADDDKAIDLQRDGLALHEHDRSSQATCANAIYRGDEER